MKATTFAFPVARLVLVLLVRTVRENEPTLGAFDVPAG
jgi:hypothetical protein